MGRTWSRGRVAAGVAGSLVSLAMLTSCGEVAEPPLAASTVETTVLLGEGWALRSSDGLTATGAEISRPGFAAAGWTPTSVPSTVLAALVRAGEVVDPYFGRNLEAIPSERFAVPWWYRTEFTVDEPLPAATRLVFDGINYRADIWLNGRRVASRDEIAGAFRVFDLDVTPYLVAGVNALAVEVVPPRPGEFTIGFVDWNPRPPDNSLGLWREVKLKRTGGVSLDDVFVRSDLEPESHTSAALTVEARLTNHLDRAVTVDLRGRAADIDIEHRIELQPGEERQLTLGPEELPHLVVESPRLWWPNNLGEPHLYRLELQAAIDGRVSDRQEVEFGIRRIEDFTTEEGHRGYRINGKPLLIRGGGWVDDLLLADDDRRLEDQIRYVRHLNLNTIRLEGFWGSTHKLFELADRYGILVWAGWSCQWEWENYLGQPVDEQYGGIDTPQEMELILASWRDQVIRLRNHPSVMVWNLASDMLPRPQLERRYRELLAEIDPTRPPLAACSMRTSEVSGPTGVKMNGPYEWVPPNYWYVDRERGGAYGFNTETGPGAQPPVAASIRRMLPEESWWPIDDLWRFHCGRGEFDDLDYYLRALESRYGAPTSLDDFALKAQVANYEAIRPMFESFSLRRPVATGVIQWMLNSAWPDMWWQLYDWYLVPTGAYYAARNANRPINVAYDYAQRKVVAINDTGRPLAGITARVRLLDLDSRVLFDERNALAVAAASRHEVVELPAVEAGGEARFLDARVLAADGELLAASFYWLAAEPDVLDWPASEWYYTPVRDFADLTGLADLPEAELEVDHRFAPAEEGWRTVQVILANPGDRLAFFVELQVSGSRSDALAAPILWDDNYVSLLPGERRVVHGRFPQHALPAGETPVFHYRGMNVAGE